MGEREGGIEKRVREDTCNSPCVIKQQCKHTHTDKRTLTHVCTHVDATIVTKMTMMSTASFPKATPRMRNQRTEPKSSVAMALRIKQGSTSFTIKAPTTFRPSLFRMPTLPRERERCVRREGEEGREDVH